MKRYLTITFFENRNVNYNFSRDPGFSKYSIEYPHNKTTIDNDQDLLDWNYKKIISDQGYISFIRNDEEIKETRISYTKNEYLDLFQDDPKQFKYKESHIIKYDSNNGSSYVITVHNRNKRISAIKNKSHSLFIAQSDGFIHTCGAFYRYSHGDKYGNFVCSEHKVANGETILLKPTELVQAVFYCKGILKLDWVLEINEDALIQDNYQVE